ncbi:MAG TPA: HAD-IIIA family hydrolase [Solirubrobacterales bacterium]|nr:HAD-IIIA family hydrolase [Solirubrobacterales bacterium]
MEPPARQVDIVVPTAGRPSLDRLLAALAPQLDELGELVVAEDRERRGPAATRNAGWRRTSAEWVVFLDDDVVPDPDWARRLHADLAGLAAGVAASQGRLRVPLPSDRRPTDWERNVAGLEGAAWISADLAVRREALAAAGGFDERFRGPYREDTDFALRLLRGGWQIVRGERCCEHPVGPAGFWTSVGKQRGNADDVLMGALHGRHWRRWGRAPRGRQRRHLAPTAVLLAAGLAAARGHRRAAAAGATAWLGLTAELAAARIAPGPRDRAEVGRMLATSAALPLAASAYRVWGALRLPVLLLRGGPPRAARRPRPEPPAAVLLDRDGTLLFDVPYNGDPGKVAPLPGARRALERLRASGTPVAVVSNQSGVRRGFIEPEQVEAVNRRAEELLGPVGAWLYCPHTPEDDCECRKPRPGLVLEAAERLGVSPDRCLVIGDIAADVQAAQAAGAAAVLVPTPRTEAEDVRMAPATAASIETAVERVMEGRR